VGVSMFTFKLVFGFVSFSFVNFVICIFLRNVLCSLNDTECSNVHLIFILLVVLRFCN